MEQTKYLKTLQERPAWEEGPGATGQVCAFPVSSARHHVSSPVTSEAAMFTAATISHTSLEGRPSLPAWASPTASEP